jgi:ADP-heptose:LPS heptosyltransferase
VKKIIISRTDSIGDVILTLPMAGKLKEMIPGCTIVFLGRDYTRDIVSLSAFVDEFISWDQIIKLKSKKERFSAFKKIQVDTIIHVFPRKEIAWLAKIAGIQNRVGTSGRLYHYFTCNQLVRFSRRRSDLHEAQLNFKLLKPLGLDQTLNLKEIEKYYGLSNIPNLSDEFGSLIDPSRVNLILHPKSKGSAREWGLSNFQQFIDLIDASKFKVFITGTEAEGQLLRKHISFNKDCIDLSGKLKLDQLLAFISKADALVAASTGPLHIAAAFGKRAIGIYPPIKPMHPGRWAPIGKNADYLVLNKVCNDCRKEVKCLCMEEIKPKDVLQKLEEYFEN